MFEGILIAIGILILIGGINAVSDHGGKEDKKSLWCSCFNNNSYIYYIYIK